MSRLCKIVDAMVGTVDKALTCFMLCSDSVLATQSKHLVQHQNSCGKDEQTDVHFDGEELRISLPSLRIKALGHAHPGFVRHEPEWACLKVVVRQSAKDSWSDHSICTPPRGSLIARGPTESFGLRDTVQRHSWLNPRQSELFTLAQGSQVM